MARLVALGDAHLGRTHLARIARGQCAGPSAGAPEPSLTLFKAAGGALRLSRRPRFARPGMLLRQGNLGEWAGAEARAGALAPAAVEVSYRRYTTLKSTARIGPGGRVAVRLSEDIVGEAAPSQAAIAHVLAARVLRRRAPEWASQAYAAWLADPRTRDLSLSVRRTRASRRALAPQGAHHDLVPLLHDVASSLFDPPLAPPPVGWTRGRGRAVLASFDEAHEAITVSRLLDHPRVSKGTLRYLLYHEMLHFEDYTNERRAREGAPPGAARRAARRRSLHPRSFRERLHRFPGWKEAEADLARACRRRSVG